MNPTADVAWICQHQDLVVGLLAWFMAVVPLSSFLAYYEKRMPPALRPFVHALAANIPDLLSAIAKMAPSPVPPEPAPKPVTPGPGPAPAVPAQPVQTAAPPAQ